MSRTSGAVVLAIVAGCGAHARPESNTRPESSARADAGQPPPKVNDRMASLISCFSAAYAATDIDAAISQCEERQFGTEWRQAALARSDAGARNGWLAPELIQASTRSRFFLFRKCYETGLSRNGGLGGRVAVKFVIDSFGRVEKAEDFGSELADAEVVACIVKEFSGLRFPKPERGTVTVVYPIHFNPGD